MVAIGLAPAVASAQPEPEETGGDEPAAEPLRTPEWPDDPPDSSVAPPPPSPYGARAAGVGVEASASVQTDSASAAARLAAHDAARAEQDEEESEAEVPRELQEGYHRHDGFFFRFGFGAGAGGLVTVGEARGASDSWLPSAIGYQVLSIGGSLVDNLVLSADMHGFADLDRAEHDDPQRITAFLGLGLTYFFMPDNVYLSGAVGPAVAALNWERWDRRTRSSDSYRDDVEIDYDRFSGIGATLSFGKEWWVHDNWGVGLGAGLMYTYTTGWEGTTASTSLHSLATTLSFTATYH